MCLKVFVSEARKKEIKDGIDRKGLTVYKVVEVKNGAYYPLYFEFDTPYKEGLDHATEKWTSDGRSPEYITGFHFFLKKSAAENLMKKESELSSWNKGNKVEFKLIECVVKKSWITEIGTEWGYDEDLQLTPYVIQELVIVAKKAIFPAPPKLKISAKKKAPKKEIVK